MLLDDLFHRLARRFQHSHHQGIDEPSEGQLYTHSQKSKASRYNHGFFNNPSNFVLNHPTFVENQVFMAGKQVLDPVLEYILPYTDADAAVDSSARFPPPLCHPGTRLKVGGELDSWLANPDRQWNIIWLHGPAGTGKSAVAQGFAERCIKNARLGASFFFSRPNQRNNPDTVIPTLVYQLAVHNHNYKSFMTARLANDPQLMRKARHIQFIKLIVEPLVQLQKQRRKRILEPLLVVLDGLDECKGEDAQRGLIEMISEAMQLRKDLPLLWLICSRPEAHLKYIFSKADYTVNCCRKELAIDAESIADVDLYVRDELAGIRSHFEDVTTPTWPSRAQIAELSDKAHGHFGFASTALLYIGDETSAAPMARFDHLLSFLGGVTTDTGKNPLEALDALYAGILHDVPDEVRHSVKTILCYYTFISAQRFSVQTSCNFYRIDQATFYSAFRKLHSVIDVPAPGAALQTEPRFYHASFGEYLQDPHRSSDFITRSDAWFDYAIMCLSWYKIDLELFHSSDGFNFNKDHQHGVLPGLKWVSEANAADVSSEITNWAATHCWWACSKVARWDDDLLSQLRNFDFRYVQQDGLGVYWVNCMNKLWKLVSLSGFIRTEPQDEIDLQLLEYMKVMTESGKPVKPAKFQLQYPLTYGRYFLLGNDSTAVVCWSTGLSTPKFIIQNCDEAPSKERIDAYQALFVSKHIRYDTDSMDEEESEGSDTM